MSQEPSIYTPDWLRKEAKLFEEWMQKKDSIFFKQFAAERGYLAQRLSEFAEKSPEFALVYARAKDWQEAKITSLALWKKLEPGMSKWVLSVHHDRIEKKEISSFDEESKELVKKSIKELGKELAQKPDDDDES